MLFLKKFLLGLGALVLILVGGSGTQSSNLILQGGGFVGLIIGLVALYIFTKMAWRAMGCLPSFLVVIGIIVFILYAIGAFNNGIGGVGQSLQTFLGRQQQAMMSAQQQTAVSRCLMTASMLRRLMKILIPASEKMLISGSSLLSRHRETLSSSL